MPKKIRGGPNLWGSRWHPSTQMTAHRLLRTVLTALVAFTACAANPAVAEQKAAAPSKSAAEDFEWRSNLGARPLTVTNSNGTIRITRASGDEARVRASKTGRDSAKVRIEVDESKDRVAVRVVHPKTLRGDTRVDFEIELPAGSELDARTANGDVAAEGLDGTIAVASTNGTVRFSGTPTRLMASSVNGRVSVDLGGVMAPSADLEAVNGRLELTLPTNVDTRVSARTVSGRIATDFDLPEHRRTVGSTVDGTLGAGKGIVRLNTVNGPIEIRRKS